MAKFRIPKIPATINKSIRFPTDIAEQVEAALVGNDCTFSAFVIEAVRTALLDLQEQAELDETARAQAQKARAFEEQSPV